MFNSYFTKPFIIIIAFLLFHNLSSAQEVKPELDKFIVDYKDLKKVPSISAGILSKGEITWLGSAGYSDIENSITATPKTIYRIASISKPITAVAVMQLVEEGRIHLDDNALKYIPYFPAKKWKFTVRQLLNHTSGIRNYKSAEEFDSKVHYNTTREAVLLMMNDPLSFQPGTKFQYTTLGYNLLAAIIENVSGMDYNSYLKKYIFEPAHMNSTYAEIQKSIVFNRAHGYIKNEYRELENAPLADLSIKYAGGGLISTPEDLLKFANGLVSGVLVKPATLDTMLQPITLLNGKVISYGLGLSFGTTDDGKYYFAHEGNGTGFCSFFVVFPKSQLAAACLINIKDRDIENPALQLALLAKGEKYEGIKISLADSLLYLTLSRNIDSAIVLYNSLAGDSDHIFLNNEDELLLFGSDLLNINRPVQAIKFFRQLSPRYPDDPAIYMVLARAYYYDKNKGMALKNFRNVLRLEPNNKYAQRMVEVLRK